MEGTFHNAFAMILPPPPQDIIFFLEKDSFCARPVRHGNITNIYLIWWTFNKACKRENTFNIIHFLY